MKKLLLIFTLIAASYFGYDWYSIQPGKKCFDRFVELDQANDLQIVDFISDNAEIILKIKKGSEIRKTKLTGMEFKKLLLDSANQHTAPPALLGIDWNHLVIMKINKTYGYIVQGIDSQGNEREMIISTLNGVCQITEFD